MEYKVDLTTPRSEDKADQYVSIVIMTRLFTAADERCES